MFVRPETIDRPIHERPSNKTFFSLCDVCITNCLASTIFLSIVILIPVRFLSTDRTKCECIHQRAAAKSELFCHQLISSNMTSRQQEEHSHQNLPEFIWMQAVHWVLTRNTWEYTGRDILNNLYLYHVFICETYVSP